MHGDNSWEWLQMHNQTEPTMQQSGLTPMHRHRTALKILLLPASVLFCSFLLSFLLFSFPYFCPTNRSLLSNHPINLASRFFLQAIAPPSFFPQNTITQKSMKYKYNEIPVCGRCLLALFSVPLHVLTCIRKYVILKSTTFRKYLNSDRM